VDGVRGRTCALKYPTHNWTRAAGGERPKNQLEGTRRQLHSSSTLLRRQRPSVGSGDSSTGNDRSRLFDWFSVVLPGPCCFFPLLQGAKRILKHRALALLLDLTRNEPTSKDHSKAGAQTRYRESLQRGTKGGRVHQSSHKTRNTCTGSRAHLSTGAIALAPASIGCVAM
jgi:hypothetical protein